ncbi:LCP family protein [Robertmurraya massiliosenegalensis]|uniref:LCP family protein n=1 Tax=Robertmurraya TaxID=2837507 RepID=UPI0039A6C7CC
MSNSRQYIRQSKSKMRRRRMFTLILLPILLLGFGLTSYGIFLYNKAESVMGDSYKPLDRDTSRVAAADTKVENTSILIIGVDDSATRGFSNSSRSDALMVATFNEKAKSIKLLSIPRDSYVYVPKLGYKDKITHAHAYGGPATTIETVEGLLDIPIDFYVKVNFNAFIDIVDALGGIEVEVPYTFSEQNSKDEANAITLEEGLQQLDGEEALALARTRKLDSDIERGKRQQEILKSIISKSISASSFTKYANVIEAVGANMETDLSFNQMKSFFNYATAGTSLDIENLNLKGQDLWLPNSNGNRIYYYEIDEPNLIEIKSTLKAHLELGTSSYGQTDDDDDNVLTEQAYGE